MHKKGKFRHQTWPMNGTEKPVKGSFIHCNWLPGVSLRRFNGRLMIYRDITPKDLLRIFGY